MRIEEVRQQYSNSPYCDQFISLMRKFEVIFQLNEKQILIPSLLPSHEIDACVVCSKGPNDNLPEVVSSNLRSYAKLSDGNYHPYCRFYRLPLIPNGFLVRLIARLLSSNFIDQLQASFIQDPLDDLYAEKKIHWRCWRNGASLLWNNKEIFRVAPIFGDDSFNKLIVVSKGDNQEEVVSSIGLELRVAMLDESNIHACSFLSASIQRIRSRNCDLERVGITNESDNPSKALCLASWLLQEATLIIDGVLEDWYEGFASQRQYCRLDANLKYYNYCRKCALSSNEKPSSTERNLIYAFTSTFCCQMAYEGELLNCPTHGMLMIREVAPDLVG